MSYLTHLELTDSGERYSADVARNNPAIDGRLLHCRYDLERMRREVNRSAIKHGPATLWRYAPLLPVTDVGNAITLSEGLTPLIHVQRLGEALGMRGLFVKDEGRNPSGTFKDRGTSVAVSRYRELGIETVIMHSSGNASASWSLYCARAGMDFVGIVPPDAQDSTRKQCALARSRTYVLHDWHAAGGIVRQAADSNGWFDVNTLQEPYRTEGKKTMGLEICEQLGWTLPDVVFYPMGGGLGAIAIYKAFEELLALGWIEGRLPKLFVTQYTGCAPVVKAYEEGRERCETWGEIDILPGGLKSPNPVGGREVLRLLRAGGGAAIGVSNEEALSAVADLAAAEGVFACPEGATTLAGLRKAVAQGLISRTERVVLMNTGNGLKSIPVLPSIAAPTIRSAADLTGSDPNATTGYASQLKAGQD